MYRAVEITEKSLDTIESVNGGVRPEIEESMTYFVTSDIADHHNEILSADDFFAKYDFDGPESLTELRPVHRL